MEQADRLSTPATRWRTLLVQAQAAEAARDYTQAETLYGDLIKQVPGEVLAQAGAGRHLPQTGATSTPPTSTGAWSPPTRPTPTRCSAGPIAWWRSTRPSTAITRARRGERERPALRGRTVAPDRVVPGAHRCVCEQPGSGPGQQSPQQMTPTCTRCGATCKWRGALSPR